MLLTFRTRALLLGGSSALALAGGSSVAAIGPASGEDRPVIVATTSIWADIVDQVDCGDVFDVQSLIPVGGDAHSFEPSIRDRDALGDAALVVANGADLEAQLHDTLESVAGDGVPVFEVAEHVTTRPMGGDEEHAEGEEHADETVADGTDEHADEEDAHDHEGDDPHVWFDPTLVIEGLPALGDALVAAGADATATAECVGTVTTALEGLDAEITEVLSVVPDGQRQLVTNHDALGYFANRYHFEVLGSVLPSSSTLVEASPAELDALSDAIDAEGVPAIFAEALEATDDATTLGERLGVDVVTLYTDSLGDEGSGAETYADMMLFDANAIATALSD